MLTHGDKSAFLNPHDKQKTRKAMPCEKVYALRVLFGLSTLYNPVRFLKSITDYLLFRILSNQQ